VPSKEEFPYALRLVSDVLASATLQLLPSYLSASRRARWVSRILPHVKHLPSPVRGRSAGLLERDVVTASHSKGAVSSMTRPLSAAPTPRAVVAPQRAGHMLFLSALPPVHPALSGAVANLWASRVQSVWRSLLSADSL